MNASKILIMFFILFIVFIPEQINPCTSFIIKTNDSLVFGTNLDFLFGEGYIFVNKRNVSKECYLESTTGQSAVWISRYGSLTFNLVGKEFAWCGINEAGLTVSTMWLDQSILPEPDSRPPVNSGFWVQYQLDNFDSVEDVINSDSIVRLADDPCHFFVCDATGTCATIEYLNGRMVHHTKDMLPIKVLTNIPYADALSFAKRDLTPENDPEDSSIYRFSAVSKEINKYDPETSGSVVDYALNILTKTVYRPHTQWSIVLDIRDKKITFCTRTNMQIRTIDLQNLDYSCENSVKMLDANAGYTGRLDDKFSDYSHQSNLLLFQNFCRRFGIVVSETESIELIRFIENYPCKPQ